MLDRETLARWGDIPQLALVSSAERDATCYLILFGYHVLDLVMGGGEDGVRPPYDVLEPFDATLMFGNGGMVEYVRRRELVEYIQIIAVFREKKASDKSLEATRVRTSGRSLLLVQKRTLT